jgi:hypothetical protein
LRHRDHLNSADVDLDILASPFNLLPPRLLRGNPFCRGPRDTSYLSINSMLTRCEKRTFNPLLLIAISAPWHQQRMHPQRLYRFVLGLHRFARNRLLRAPNHLAVVMVSDATPNFLRRLLILQTPIDQGLHDEPLRLLKLSYFPPRLNILINPSGLAL